MITDVYLILPLFFVIALCYSSAGFGGGSSYLAILSLFSMEYTSIKTIALLCNIIVVSGGTFVFAKGGFLNIKKIAPLILWSIPLAYLGGRFALEKRFFFLLLGFSLLIAAIFILLPIKSLEKKYISSEHFAINGFLGGSIGFLSGLVGIGGGIFLAPILHLLRWNTAKVIAATASFFILVNSIAGLCGQMSSPTFSINWHMAAYLLFAVFLGGQIGSRISVQKLSQQHIRKVTALLLLIVAIRLLIKYL